MFGFGWIYPYEIDSMVFGVLLILLIQGIRGLMMRLVVGMGLMGGIII